MRKADVQETTRVDTFNLAAKSDLAILKAEVDEVDINKLKNVPADLIKDSNVVDTDVVKKVNDKLVTKM